MSNKMSMKPVLQEIVKLPSRGMIYDNLPETFSIRPMTVNELKMLYGAGSTMNALNQIIESVVDVKNFPINDLISADKLYLAFLIRAITFGEMYKAKPYCSYCKKNIDVEFNLLNDIEIDYLPDNFENPRNIGKLPISGDEIELKLLTTGDFERIINRSKEIKKKFEEYVGDPIYPVTLASQIASVNGKKMGSRDLEEYVLDLHAMDDLYINKKVKEVKVGPKIPVEVSCPECGSTLYVNISVSEDFFRPELDF